MAASVYFNETKLLRQKETVNSLCISDNPTPFCSCVDRDFPNKTICCHKTYLINLVERRVTATTEVIGKAKQ